MRWWNRDGLRGLLLAVLTLLAYQPVWHAGYIMDDDAFLVNNPLIHRADGLYRFWFTTMALDYFPMTFTTVWLEWRLWGNHPLGYHLVNVLLHALSAGVLWRVLLKLKIPGAWLAAAVFALHPVNVESVAWIAQRKNTLAMFFFALSLLSYLQFEDTRQRRWYWIALGGFVLALSSKTAVAPLPLVLLGLAWWRRGRVTRTDVIRSLAFFGAAIALGLIATWFQYHQAIGSDLVRPEGFWSRLGGAGWAIWFYLFKTVWPVNLMFVYPRWRIDPANVLSYVPGLLLVAGLLLTWRFRRTWGKGLLFGLGYFIVMLLPVLGFVDIYYMIYSLVADHWQYFSIPGPIALVAAGITTASGRLQERKRVVALLLGGLLLATLGSLTWRQTRIYLNKETLWRETIARNPECSMAYNNLGNVLLDKGQVDAAITHFRTALQLQPDDASAHFNLGNALLGTGRLDEAFPHFRTAAQLKPHSAEAHNNLGWVLLQQGQVETALAHFQTAAKLRPAYPMARFNLGNALIRQGRLDEAIVQYQKAAELQTNFAAAYNNLGMAFLQKGDVDAALAQFRKGIGIRPHSAEGHYNLANALVRKGRRTEAIAQYQETLNLQPGHAAACNNLAWLLATAPEASLRNGTRAIELAQQVDRLSGGTSPLVISTLAAAYAEAGQFAEAITAVERGLQLAADQTNIAAMKGLRAHLQLYQNGSPLRDPGPAASPGFPEGR